MVAALGTSDLCAWLATSMHGQGRPWSSSLNVLGEVAESASHAGLPASMLRQAGHCLVLRSSPACAHEQPCGAPGSSCAWKAATAGPGSTSPPRRRPRITEAACRRSRHSTSAWFASRTGATWASSCASHSTGSAPSWPCASSAPGTTAWPASFWHACTGLPASQAPGSSGEPSLSLRQVSAAPLVQGA